MILTSFFFQIKRCSHEIESFKEKSIQVDSDSIDEAIDWLNDWSHCYAITANPLSTCEALLEALNDSKVFYIEFFSLNIKFHYFFRHKQYI